MHLSKSTFTLLAVAAALSAADAAASPTPGLIASGIDLIASVQQNVIPGGTLFDGAQTVLDADVSPVETAQKLRLAPDFGFNLSGRSPQIIPAFGAALSESDGNGGVGVSSWMFTFPGRPADHAVAQLAAQASWAQSLTWGGTQPTAMSLRLHVPQLQVGLIGVAPRRSSVSATETARAQGLVQSVIIHPDGTQSAPRSMLFGVEIHEEQLLLGGSDYANFVESSLLGSPISVSRYSVNDDPFNPIYTVELDDFDVALGTLAPGDTVRYVYTLTASGTTAGGEHGYLAFIGDPFGAGASGNPVIPVLAPPAGVPEPGAGWLALLGLVALRARPARRPA